MRIGEYIIRFCSIMDAKNVGTLMKGAFLCLVLYELLFYYFTVYQIILAKFKKFSFPTKCDYDLMKVLPKISKIHFKIGSFF